MSERLLEAEYPAESKIIIARPSILRQLGARDEEREIESGDELRIADAMRRANTETRIRQKTDGAGGRRLTHASDALGQVGEGGDADTLEEMRLGPGKQTLLDLQIQRGNGGGGQPRIDSSYAGTTG